MTLILLDDGKLIKLFYIPTGVYKDVFALHSCPHLVLLEFLTI